MVVILAGLVALNFYSGFSGSPNPGGWRAGPAYPLTIGASPGVLGQSCVDSAGYVYCIGGEDANDTPTASVYFAPVSDSGLGNWSLSANPYPTPIVFQSCAASSGFVYCVGGVHDTLGSDTAASFYSTLSPAGVGAWSAGTPFPIPADALSCVTSSGDIYCVGGENETSGASATTQISRSVWFAPVSPSGIGAWSRASDYPTDLYFPSCSGLGSYVYCVGGEDSQHDPQNSTYYSYVTPSGMGAWTAGPDYPIQTIAGSCSPVESTIYCVGGLQAGGETTGAVYYSAIGSSGMGKWQPGPTYPSSIATNCASNLSVLYCVGGYAAGSGPTGDSNFVSLNPTSSSSATS
jgi:hypothetical protein